MLWDKETELINLEPLSGAQSLLGYVSGILARDIFLPLWRSRVDFVHFQAVQFTSIETKEWSGDKPKDSIPLADSSEEIKA